MAKQHINEGSVGSGRNRSRGSSQALRLVEQEWMRERHGHDGNDTRDNSHAASPQGERMVPYETEGSYHSDRDRELEGLHR